jgi:hypothetical protein
MFAVTAMVCGALRPGSGQGRSLLSLLTNARARVRETPSRNARNAAILRIRARAGRPEKKGVFKRRREACPER